MFIKKGTAVGKECTVVSCVSCSFHCLPYELLLALGFNKGVWA